MREAMILVGILGPVFWISSLLWNQQYGDPAMLPFAVAAGSCVFFGALALVTQEMAFRRGANSAGNLGSIALRTLGPLFSAILVSFLAPEWAEHQVFLAFVCCYLLTLFVETILSACLILRWEGKKAQDTTD